MRSTQSLHIRTIRWFLTLVLFIGVAMISTPSHSGEAEDYIKKMTEKCKELTQRQDELARQAAQRGQSASPEVAASLERLKTLANSAQQLIAEGPPQDPSKREEYARNLSAIVGASASVTRSAQRSMGIGPMGALDRWLDADTSGLKTRFGRFDGAKPLNPTDRDIDIPRARDNDFFGGARPQASGATPVPVTGAVLKTTEADAQRITAHDGHWGGGVMLEGTATAVGRNSRVRYNSEFNALVVDDRSIYLLSIAPWTVAVLCQAIAADEKGLVGVSLTGEDRLFFGKGKSAYQDSDLGRDLTLADRFLGDIIFASGKWTAGYKYFDALRRRQPARRPDALRCGSRSPDSSFVPRQARSVRSRAGWRSALRRCRKASPRAEVWCRITRLWPRDLSRQLSMHPTRATLPSISTITARKELSDVCSNTAKSPRSFED